MGLEIRTKQSTILEETQQHVNACLPLIEERIERKLPPVTVKPISHWAPDARKRVYSLLRGDGHRAVTSFIKAHNAVRNAEAAYQQNTGESTTNVSAAYNGNTLYVNTKVATIDDRLHNRLMVHELGHLVWDVFSDYQRFHEPEAMNWNEGFAMYCEQEWFADINPPQNDRTTVPLHFFPSAYRRDYENVSTIVNRHGKEILYELPTRWPEFDKQ